MTNSLNAGGREKTTRLAQLVNFISGSRFVFKPGSKLQTPLEASLPSTCVVGEICTNGADANKLYQCTATDTWTKVGTQA